VATSGDYNDLSNKPAPFDSNTLAKVATSGSYNDLLDKPEENIVLKDINTSYKYNVFIKNGTLTTAPICISIRVDSIPDKQYIEGDTLDLSGAVIVAVYEDGSERQVTGFTYPETTDQEVEITYTEFGGVWKPIVTIPAISLTGIRVDSIPDVEYIPGAALDLSGAVICATFSDGTEKQITGFAYPETVPLDTKQVEITYSAYGKIVATTIYLPIMNIDDFTYTENEDGTKTITGWNGTLLGVTSTEIMIPDSPNIIV